MSRDRRASPWVTLLATLALPLGAVAQEIRLGREFQVNTYTTGNQSYHSIAAAAADGDFVIVWHSVNQDGSYGGIFGRRFTSAGTRLATEFQVNTHTIYPQVYPSLAADPDGDFIVTWTSEGQEGSITGVFARRFSSPGVALATEFQVNTYTIGFQADSSVAMDADGDFVVAWVSEHDGSYSGVFARRFTSAGAALGVEFQVNTTTISYQQRPSLAVGANGAFVAVWRSDDQDGDDFGIFARRFSSTGVAIGGELQVNTYTTNEQLDPSVAVDGDGDFVAAWTSFLNDGDDFGVFARRFSSTGAALAGEFQVNTYTWSFQYTPWVAAQADGDFMIAWSGYGDGSSLGSFGRRFSSAGVALASEFQINSYTPSDQRNPAVVFDARGHFVVAWQDFGHDGAHNGIFAQRFAVPLTLDFDGDLSVEPLTDGLLLLRYLFGFSGATLVGGAVDLANCSRCDAPSIEAYLAAQLAPLPLAVRVGSEFQVNLFTFGFQGYHTVAAQGDGDFVVTWDRVENPSGTSSFGAFGRRFSSAGTPLGGEFQINTYTPGLQNYSTVTVDLLGDFVVAWSSTGQDGSDRGVFARRFASAGNAVGGEFQVNSYTQGIQSYARASASLTGDFVVAWASTGQDGSDRGIFGRRFSSTGPLATEFQINLYTPSSQGLFPSLAADLDGDFVVTWGSYYQDGSGAGVFARRFSDAGLPLTGELQMNTYTQGVQRAPSVAVDEFDAEFVVAWSSAGQDGSGNGVFARRFSAGSVGQASEFQVNTNTLNDQDEVFVAAEQDGDFVVAWTSEAQDGSLGGIFARRFSSLGHALTGELQVNSYTMGSQTYPAIAMNGDRGFVVVWQSDGQDGSADGLFAQRFLASAMVDIDGNGSSEPLTDGLLALRYLFGFRGAALTTGAIGAGCTRCDAPSIEAYLQGLSG